MLSALRLNTGSVRKSSSLLNLVIPGGSILARGLSTNANSSTTGKKLKKAHDTYVSKPSIISHYFNGLKCPNALFHIRR